MQRTSNAGLMEIMSHEAIVTAPYYDSVSVLTIFIGHTASAGSPNPGSYAKGTQRPVQEAIDVFRTDIAKYEDRVRRAFTRVLTQKQFDAAVSFDFNTGAIFDASWVKRFNAGDMKGAREAFMWYNKPKEIIERRKKECTLFFDGKYSSDGRVSVYPADARGRVQWSEGKRVDVSKLLGGRGAENFDNKMRETLSNIQSQEPAPTPVSGPNKGKATAAGGVAVIVGAAISYFWDKIEALIHSVF